MGKVWTRDGQAQATQAERPSSGSHANRTFRRVWTRDSQATQNGASAAVEPPRAAAGRAHGPGNAEEEQVAKRRRLAAKGRLAENEYAPHQPRHESQNGHVGPILGVREPTAAGSREARASEASNVQAVRLEALALRRRIAEEEAKLKAAKEAAHRKAADQAAAEAAKQETQQLRKSRLDAGFAEAFKAARELAASQRGPRVAAADDAEVRRVLAAKSDHDVLRLKPGADRETIKRTYRAMTLALHPDKCKAASATDAFQRLVHAYQGALKYAR